ncbi:dihydrolipoyl dehydrogenase [Leptospira bouyouniensis]|uniref:Dihydrolipoyl dehydrogenase n=1 Tax=Leptospira bouyouniensis TaxID=2484911 RepID=A0ABY2L2C8_9LEPT|nr:dihydrolipoyl dehydrogenase [Leptospira bouyouniensis]TGK46954.1 dihydrolipoyl dehydrogenase [Leptospira bouyouniensis]
MEQYDIIVIGAGPGGYVAAVRAAQLGKKVAIIEKRKTLGGTCLNVGCIPSKALLDSSEEFHKTKHKLADHGISVKDVKIDIAKMMARKDKVVSEVTSGVDYLMKKNKITRYLGHASFVSKTEVSITAEDGKKESISGTNIIIATGSTPIEIPPLPVDGKNIVTSDHAIGFDSVPEHLIIVGAGVIGLELGSVWLRLGAKVTVVELMPRLFGTADQAMASLAERLLTQQGINFLFETKVHGAKVKGKKVEVEIEGKDGKKTILEGDKVLVSIGRRPNTDGLGAKEIGIEITDRGRVKVEPNKFQTNIPNIYAIGDVVDGPMLAHKAEDEGIAVAELICGKYGHVNYKAIPWIVYTWPEVAWVGQGEEELKAKGIEYKVGKYMFKPNARAKAMNETDGQVKVLADKKTDKLLGVYIVGPRASDMIAEAAIAFEFGASAEDIARSTHAHPTLSEVLREAAMDADAKWSIHS